MLGRILLGTLILSTTGCLNVPLRYNSVNQARTVGELYQQQVLNNLAMFATDPYALPHFSYANQGSTGITDTGTAAVSPSWGPTLLFANLGTTFTGQMSGNSNFTLTPVNDPRKLELMRCAYQKVVAACCGTDVASYCPDCETRFKTFYTGDVNGVIRDSHPGEVTSECIGQTCWFGVGCRKHIPKNCDCSLIGHYGNTWVWVLPGGRDELTKLTLTILDYAQNNPPTQVQKTVEYYLDERGLPTSFAKAVSKVTAQIGVTENNLSLLSQPRADEVELRDALEKELDDINNQIADAQARNRVATLEQLIPKQEELQAKLNYLNQQLKAGGLKEEYRQGFVPPASPGLLQFGQSFNALTQGIGVPSGSH